MLNKINEKISKRTNYGIRRETAYEAGYVISWSNAKVGWVVYSNRIEKGEVIVLDANQVFVECENKDDVMKIVSSLDGLPLYKQSFEYVNLR